MGWIPPSDPKYILDACCGGRMNQVEQIKKILLGETIYGISDWDSEKELEYISIGEEDAFRIANAVVSSLSPEIKPVE